MRRVLMAIAIVPLLALAACGHEDPCHGCEDHQRYTDVGATDVEGADDGSDDPARASEEQAVAFCDCMFGSCHDFYHDTWGQDESIARAGCLSEARRQLSLGRATQSEPSIECRQFYCDATEGNPSLCGNVLAACEM